jgi:branched-chain amino acid transport system substrate-binding protein
VFPYEDTATGKVKDWLVNYRKMFGIDANTQAILGYNCIQAFAFFANLAGKDLSGEKLLAALESGQEFHDIFGSPPGKFSPTNHFQPSRASPANPKRPLEGAPGRLGVLT